MESVKAQDASAKEQYPPEKIGTATAPTVAGAYRASTPQNVERPTVPIINLAMEDVAALNGGVLPKTGGYLRKTAVTRARERLGLNENSAVYIPASNVMRDGEEYVLKITRTTLNKMLSPADGSPVPPESVAIMENLERIANNGVYFRSEGDRKGRDHINGIDHLMTTVYIDGTPALVDMRVRLVQQVGSGPTENVLYYFTPEAITIQKGNGNTPAAERQAFRGEASPFPDITLPRGAETVKAQDTPVEGPRYLPEVGGTANAPALSKKWDGGLPGGTGARGGKPSYESNGDPTPKRKTSQVRSNTYERSGIFSEAEKALDGLRQEDLTYDVMPEKLSMERAEERLATDYEGAAASSPTAQHPISTTRSAARTVSSPSSGR